MIPPPPAGVSIPEWGVWAAALVLLGPKALELVMGFGKWSAARNVQHEDEAKRDTKTKLEQHEREIAALRLDASTARTGLAGELGAISGRLQQLDTRIAEQGKAHDGRLAEALKEMATDFNRKLTTTINIEIERTVRAVVREELGAMKGKVK